jgi:two-component system NtrC family sensor kinase
MSIVFTVREKCKRCYACIRSCPVKAIRVKEGQAEVMKERCIACGTCVRVCATGAKQVENDVGLTWQLLGQYPSVIAILSSSFPAAFAEVRPRQMVTALKKLGFSEVMETAFGAELIAREYHRLVEENGERSILSSTCPAVVSFIEKFYPQLIGNLAPIVSPMIAMGRLIKWQYNPKAKVVFIGPCIAKKAEGADEKVAGVIDAVLTFTELREMLAARGIDPSSEDEGQFTGPQSHLGRLFSIPGGLLKVAGLCSDISSNDIVIAEGKDRVVNCVREFAEGKIRTKFLDLFFCEGCICGPAVANDLCICGRRELIVDYTMSEADPAQAERDAAEYVGIDLSRRFSNRFTALDTPSEEEISGVLARINKAAPEDQLNCGACGYNTCRELATAVCQGLAESEMCWHYLIQRLQTAQEELIQAEKLTSLGQMAAAIAHEINNPLAGVLVYTKLLMKKTDGNTLAKEEALSYLSKMEAEISHSSRIIRNLLDFARQTEPKLRETDVNQAIEKALSLVAHQAQMQGVKVIKELNPSLPPTIADSDQLQQVFTNLILNAIQAMPQGGELALRTALIGDGQLKLDVQDTGYGISKENLRKLFTPFFTTKEKGKGVGLGLAVAHGIIERHKGKIEVQSEVGKGTTFSIYLSVGHEQEG